MWGWGWGQMPMLCIFRGGGQMSHILFILGASVHPCQSFGGQMSCYAFFMGEQMSVGAFVRTQTKQPKIMNAFLNLLLKWSHNVRQTPTFRWLDQWAILVEGRIKFDAFTMQTPLRDKDGIAGLRGLHSFVFTSWFRGQTEICGLFFEFVASPPPLVAILS